MQVDIKRVLAYSTVSQLGYMMMGLGVGAWLPAVFHIFTHAFFKACLFLGAGSVSHSASHHSFDMKKDMGGLWRKMPITFGTFVISTLALAGLPPLAGFFSKDEIIDNAGANGYRVFQIIGLFGAFLTAAYMTRCVYLTFLGQAQGSVGRSGRPTGTRSTSSTTTACWSTPVSWRPASGATSWSTPRPRVPWPRARRRRARATTTTTARTTATRTAHGDHGDHRGPHESNWLITVPLVVLAVGALVAGFLQAPAFNIEKFKEWVEPAGVALLYDEGEAVQAGEELALAARRAEGEARGEAAAEAVTVPRRSRRGPPASRPSSPTPSSRGRRRRSRSCSSWPASG